MEQVRQAAEAQARRSAPDRQDVKRRRVDALADEVKYKELLRYEYEGADALVDGGRGFVVLCGFRRCACTPWARAPAHTVRPSYLHLILAGQRKGPRCAERRARRARPQPCWAST